MRLAFFVSAHGFGHAARACAMMSAIAAQRKGCRFEIFTLVPRWFFEDSLADGFDHHPVMTDVGLIQRTALHADLGKTLAALAAFLPFPGALVDTLAREVAARGCKAVVCDISPLGIAVAKAAGLPSILVENFTWDWLYETYVDAYPRFQEAIDYLGRQFQSATIHIQTDPICSIWPRAARLFPISRPPRTPAKEVRAGLMIPEGMPAVLITMGGVPWRHGFAAHLGERPDVCFILPQDIPEIRREGNRVHLPMRSAYYHPDLVRAASAVVGKVGYSTLAEVCHAGKPFGYIPRKGFRESPTLEAYADAFAAGAKIPEEKVKNGRWLEDLDRLLETPLMRPLPNAAGQAADIILECARGIRKPKIPVPTEPSPLRFDPFSVRKARNIRNQLSEAFVEALAKETPAHVEQMALHLMRHTSGFVYRQYITDRLERYRRLFHQVKHQAIVDPLAQTIPIWNARLFFECHEHLEPIWMASRGDRREALKGLIKAAGVYVHLDRGNRTAAERLAAKAALLLERYPGEVAFIGNVHELLEALRNPKGPAPRLRSPEKVFMEHQLKASINNSRRIHRGRVFDILSENITLPNGVTTDIDILRHPGAAAIVPMADDRTLVWLRQYRHATGGFIWEIPAGTLDAGESPLVCAKRELIEETGFSSECWQLMGEIVPVPGYSSERIHLYLAMDLKQASQHLDQDELLEVHRIALDEAIHMIFSGQVVDAKTITGLLMARQWLKSGAGHPVNPGLRIGETGGATR
jgi:8-oxo-dGTP pyrophosphatase MutT (NUDIX family)